MEEKKKERGKRIFYKGSKFIVFYDMHDEYIENMFDNVKEILKYKKLPLTPHNLNLLNVEIYRALRREGHKTRILNKWNRVYIYDVKEEDDDDDSQSV